MSSSRITRYLPFLEALLRNISNVVREADKSHIAFLVECCHNVSKIALTRASYGVLSKYVPVIRKIGKCRDVAQARSLLDNFGEFFLPTLVPAVIQHALQQKVSTRADNRANGRRSA